MHAIHNAGSILVAAKARKSTMSERWPPIGPPHASVDVSGVASRKCGSCGGGADRSRLAVGRNVAPVRSWTMGLTSEDRKPPGESHRIPRAVGRCGTSIVIQDRAE